jgi:hypothetical protein
VRPAFGTAVAVALCAAAAAGCGVGPGDDAGEVELTVSRDYGSEVLVDESDEISESDTVLRLLDGNAEVETRYGGGFVQSIDGLSGGRADGRASDWFFYVNGIESSVGAAEYGLGDGERVWWDYHDWTSAMRVPAVVGSWPEPFLHGFNGERYETQVSCPRARDVCMALADQLADAGADVVSTVDKAQGPPAGSVITVVAGTWDQIRSDPDARLLAHGPERSGVFARFSGDRHSLLNLLNQRAEIVGSLGRGAGLVAALRPDDDPPTWVVTGTNRAGVIAAANLLGPRLDEHFAAVTDGEGEPIGVPVP